MNDLMMMVFVEKPSALLGSANYYQGDNYDVILMLYNSLSLILGWLPEIWCLRGLAGTNCWVTGWDWLILQLTRLDKYRGA